VAAIDTYLDATAYASPVPMIPRYCFCGSHGTRSCPRTYRRRLFVSGGLPAPQETDGAGIHVRTLSVWLIEVPS